jgi:hypothetical protein
MNLLCPFYDIVQIRKKHPSLICVGLLNILRVRMELCSDKVALDKTVLDCIRLCQLFESTYYVFSVFVRLKYVLRCGDMRSTLYLHYVEGSTNGDAKEVSTIFISLIAAGFQTKFLFNPSADASLSLVEHPGNVDEPGIPFQVRRDDTAFPCIFAMHLL